MRWKVHGQQTLYQSNWVNLELADVELPDGRHLDHHVLRMHRQSASAAVIDDQGRVLMLWRHRFITDRWGWELPCGWVDPGEDPAEATRREVLEETGWEPGPLLRCRCRHQRCPLPPVPGRRGDLAGTTGRQRRGNPDRVDSPQRDPRTARSGRS
jgi:8-oxo-dGTP pyrophosphatase MutT (NUDIX family)